MCLRLISKEKLLELEKKARHYDLALDCHIYWINQFFVHRFLQRVLTEIDMKPIRDEFERELEIHIKSSSKEAS